MAEITELVPVAESKLALSDDDDSTERLRPPADITDLATVLKTEENLGEKDFIFRKGRASDVYNSTNSNSTQSPKGKSQEV